MFQKPSKELPRIWNNMCTNYSAQFELMAYGTVPGAKGPAPQLAYSNLAPSHTALRANKLFIYSVNSACPGEFKHGDSFCEVRLFRNMGKENQQKLNALDWLPPFYSWLSKTPGILQGKLLSKYFMFLFHIIIFLSFKSFVLSLYLQATSLFYSPFFFSLSVFFEDGVLFHLKGTYLPFFFLSRRKRQLESLFYTWHHGKSRLILILELLLLYS